MTSIFDHKYVSLIKKNSNDSKIEIYSKKLLTHFGQIRIMRSVHNDKATYRSEQQFGKWLLSSVG
ncbi:conserved protein of unknown function [Vibrio tapetis subsp. tapetis]|uniref:Uncharacterized protein n=1 Tax=Vibrio tapetis subsp. tapetis TaxID=1671868 RepID=A0A2N8ZBY4_9VIBR|nr:conserved protein of unknown function [Vibrio tapetis subsp. tapetis]